MPEGEAIPEDFNRPEDAPAPEHTQWGAYLIETLYPKFKSLKGYQARVLLDGARDHHERWNGSGAPFGKAEAKIGFLGRMVALADELDHRAMVKKSEDPVGDVLKELKAEAEAGKFDPELFRAFRASAPSLRRVFNASRDTAAAVPVTATWIRRRSGRPMELQYREARERERGEAVWLAEMRLRGTKGGTEPYDELRQQIAARKFGAQLGEYFLYELCDALRRFATCGAESARAIVELPEAWYTQKNLAEIVRETMDDEAVSPEQVRFLIPDAVLKRPGKQFAANRAECAEAGIVLLTREELNALLTEERGALQREDEIAGAAIAKEGRVT